MFWIFAQLQALPPGTRRKAIQSTVVNMIVYCVKLRVIHHNHYFLSNRHKSFQTCTEIVNLRITQSQKIGTSLGSFDFNFTTITSLQIVRNQLISKLLDIVILWWNVCEHVSIHCVKLHTVSLTMTVSSLQISKTCSDINHGTTLQSAQRVKGSWEL